MKKIDYDYWKGYKDADYDNPDLRVAMQQLYGRKGFDFGIVRDRFYDTDTKNHCRPDGYSSYTVVAPKGYYISEHPFREKAVRENKELADRCYFLASTIAGELFFPCHKFNGQTMNPARGNNKAVNDMVYVTLESIRKYYAKERVHYPLKDDIERYAYFFDRFASFDEYIEYNLLQDYELLPKKFPRNEKELVDFWKRSVEFLEARLRRIEEYAEQNGLFDE